MNWLGDQPLEDLPADGFSCFAKVRSTRSPAPAILRVVDGEVSVELMEGEAGIAPGQACALYSGQGENARVYGGGFIRRSERERPPKPPCATSCSRPPEAAGTPARSAARPRHRHPSPFEFFPSLA